MLNPITLLEEKRAVKNSQKVKFSKMIRSSIFVTLSKLLTQFFSHTKEYFSFRYHIRATARSLARALSRSLARAFSRLFLRTSAYTLSFALISAPVMTLALPSSALSASVASAEANDKNATFNFTFGVDGTGTPFISSVQLYNIFAGNVGNATEYKDFYTSNASAHNNTFSVLTGAKINEKPQLTDTPYEIRGAAGHIALIGEGNTATATGNTAIMDAKFEKTVTEEIHKHDDIPGLTESTQITTTASGYIASLTGAYIGINDFAYLKDAYAKTTVDTVSASNNSVILKDGSVGYGFKYANATYKPVGQEKSYDLNYKNKTLEDAGTYLAGAIALSKNTNNDALFILSSNSALVTGGYVGSNIGRQLSDGSLAGAHVSTVTGHGTLSHNSVTITGGDIQAEKIGGAAFAGIELSTNLVGSDKELDTNTNELIDVAFNIRDILEIAGFANNHSTATMSHNSVSIAETGSDFTARHIAGAFSTASSTSTLNYNSVNISGGKFVSRENSIDQTLPLSIVGASITPELWVAVVPEGGDVDEDDGRQMGTFTTKSVSTIDMTASHNSVTITGGTIQGHSGRGKHSPSTSDRQRRTIYTRDTYL